MAADDLIGINGGLGGGVEVLWNTYIPTGIKRDGEIRCELRLEVVSYWDFSWRTGTIHFSGQTISLKLIRFSWLVLIFIKLSGFKIHSLQNSSGPYGQLLLFPNVSLSTVCNNFKDDSLNSTN